MSGEPISNFDRYCTGIISQPTENKYITGLVLSVAKVKRTFEHHGSKTLDAICAFDKAEAAEAYLGQTNIIYVSSFCSPNSYIWGYHLARSSRLFEDHPLLGECKIEDSGNVAKIYSANSLMLAFKSLVGTKHNKKFPFYPGTHLPAAGKSIELVGPANLYSAIGIGLPENGFDGNTFMEDIGTIPLMIEGQQEQVYKKRILFDIAKSVLTIGKEQGVKFKSIFVEIKSIEVAEDEVGSSLVMVPYFNLAKKAIPKMGIDSLKNISLEDWIDIAK